MEKLEESGGPPHPLLYDLVLWVLTNSLLAGSWCCFSPNSLQTIHRMTSLMCTLGHTVL